MTKTQTRELAKRATQYGYSQSPDVTQAYVKCPKCPETVTAYRFAWEKWTAAKWLEAFVRHVEDYAINEQRPHPAV